MPVVVYVHSLTVVAAVIFATGATALVIALQGSVLVDTWGPVSRGNHTFRRASRRFFLVWVLT